MESSRDQIEEIKNRLDIINVVGKYVQLKQAGKNFSGLCPFHSEKTPSFIVSPELQRYKCFGCGEAGDIFTFIQKIENIDFLEVLEKLAKEAGITLQKQKDNSQFSRLIEINEKAAIFFFRELKKTKQKNILEYVYKRGITDESIKKFGIGYAFGSTELLNFIQKDKKYSKAELLSSGLFVEKEGKIRSKFYKRLMFPIRSSSGKVIAFTGRVLPGNDFGPKYMNSPETPIYHKASNLYGQYESRQQARKDDLVIICEGTTDVISSHQIGIQNIVAPLGTALTKEQLQKISKLSNNILFLFDNDSAGQKALERAFILSQTLSLNTYANSTAPYKDVDSMILEDPKAFSTLVKKKIDAFTYMLTQFVKDKNLNNFEDYNRIVSWLRNVLSNVSNRTVLEFYVKKARHITQIEPFENGVITPVSRKGFKGNEKMPQKPDLETLFLQSYIFQKNAKFVLKFDLKYFDNKHVKNVLSFILKNSEISREQLLGKYNDDDVIKNIIEDSIFSFSQEESAPEELENIYNNIIKEYYKRREREYGVKIASLEQLGKIKESEKLLKEFQELTKEKQKHEQNSGL